MSVIYFDDEDDAAELIDQLHAQGYATVLTRAGFAGEDDSADRAWVLVVEPFDALVVEMVDVYGGWLPGDERLEADAFDLPDAPRRSTD